MSAVTQNDYTGNGSTTNYSFTFPYLKASDVKCSLDAVDTTAFTLANATTVQFNTAPTNGAKIKIFRETSVDNLTATFYAGSACLLYTSPSPRDRTRSRMPSSA